MPELDDMILAEGDDTRKKVDEKPPVNRKKTVYVKLKDGEQLRGFLLTTSFVMYYNHGDYEKGIKSHPCSDPKNGKDCLSCQHGIKRVKKTVVPFFNVDTKQVEIFDATPKQMKAIYSFTDEYADDALTTAISFKRSGESTSTTYSITPLSPATLKKEAATFVAPTDIVIDRDFYASILSAPDEDYVREILGLKPSETPSAPTTDSDAGLPPISDTATF